MNYQRLSIALVLTAVLIGSGCCLASPSSAPHSSRGSSVYSRLIARYHSLNTYSAIIRSHVVLQPVNGSQPNTVDTTLTVFYKSPNLFRIEAQGLMGGGLRVSDGTTLYTYSAMLNQYGAEAAPHDLFSQLMSGASTAPTLSAVGNAVVNGALTTEYMGQSGKGSAGRKFVIYINQASGLIERITIKQSSLPGPQGAAFRLSLQEDYLSQKQNPPISAGLFHFTPPSGAQKAQSGEMPSITGFGQ